MVTMHVEPEVVDDRVRQIVDQARRFASRPGFVSCCVHRSSDRTKIVEYIQWASIADLQAAAGSVEEVHPPDFAISIDVTVLDVVEVVEPARD
ncbi:MAG: antibiotic biosynthesis monooxygenase [Mycobacterium kyogaense]